MSDYLKQFDVIVLDMNNTFMFGGDRFSLSENYYVTYQKLGGTVLQPAEVSRAINGVFSTLDLVYRNANHHDEFPSVEESLGVLAEAKGFSVVEKKRLVEVFAVHELGDIPENYVQALRRLAKSHQLHLVSNIWSLKERFVKLLDSYGLSPLFESLTFSSDTRSVKPSPKLFEKVLEFVDVDKSVLIGDCLRCDIDASNSIGLKSIWLSHGRSRTPNDIEPNLIANDLLSLLEKTSIENETLRLRPTGLLDVPFVLNAENDEDNSPFVVNWTKEQHLASLNDDDVCHMIIEDLNTMHPVGYSILRGLSREKGPIELKRLVITEKRNGFGRNTLALTKQLVFRRWKRRRLWLNVLPNNQRAISLYHSSGFRYEGTWRESFLVEGGYADLELMTVLATDEDSSAKFESKGTRFSVVRNLSSRHFQQFCEMYDIEWPSESRTRDDLRRAVLGSEIVIGVVELNSDNLVGFCRVVSDRGFRAWVYGLVVEKEYRGYGLGRLIMEHVLGSEQLQGIHSVSLTCAPELNDFYAKFGFKLVDRETVMSLPLRQ